MEVSAAAALMVTRTEDGSGREIGSKSTTWSCILQELRMIVVRPWKIA
jgi:hypothetical protein